MYSTCCGSWHQWLCFCAHCVQVDFIYGPLNEWPKRSPILHYCVQCLSAHLRTILTTRGYSLDQHCMSSSSTDSECQTKCLVSLYWLADFDDTYNYLQLIYHNCLHSVGNNTYFSCMWHHSWRTCPEQPIVLSMGCCPRGQFYGWQTPIILHLLTSPSTLKHQNTKNNNSDISAIYSSPHQLIIDTACL